MYVPIGDKYIQGKHPRQGGRYNLIDVPLQQGKAIIQMYGKLNTQTRLTPNIGNVINNETIQC